MGATAGVHRPTSGCPHLNWSTTRARAPLDAGAADVLEAVEHAGREVAVEPLAEFMTKVQASALIGARINAAEGRPTHGHER